jgi:transposase-like protein
MNYENYMILELKNAPFNQEEEEDFCKEVEKEVCWYCGDYFVIDEMNKISDGKKSHYLCIDCLKNEENEG